MVVGKQHHDGTYDSGRVFYTPKDKGEVIFMLKRGRVNLFRIAPDGRKLVTAQLQHGTVFGEMAMFGQGMYGCHAEAARDCLICVLSRPDLTGLVMRNPQVALNLMQELGNWDPGFMRVSWNLKRSRSEVLPHAWRRSCCVRPMRSARCSD